MHVLFAFPLIWLECPLICTLCPTYPNLTAISTLLFNATLISAAQVTGIKDRSQQPMCYDWYVWQQRNYKFNFEI